MIRNRKRKILSSIDVSGKEGKVLNSRNALYIRRSLTTLKTLKRFLRRYSRQFAFCLSASQLNYSLATSCLINFGIEEVVDLARGINLEVDSDDVQKLMYFHIQELRIDGLIEIDEAHFWLNGYVNKQNCRIWSEANPQVYGETPLHPEKLTVWCALWADGIIGPYFFKNDEGHNVTVNDGATCHTARATIDLLKDTFGDHLISRFGSVNWPPRSSDLTPLDNFLWSYVKSLVNADKPQTLDHLEDNIRSVIADIRPQMLEKIIENWTSRLDYIRASHGSPMPEIIFKM
ncbi:DUF4817 domain-containing protein [Trichonephila clavipes]|nr:DUF4817 domain-containing protein [Trichonephila clavipes]